VQETCISRFGAFEFVIRKDAKILAEEEQTMSENSAQQELEEPPVSYFEVRLEEAQFQNIKRLAGILETYVPDDGAAFKKIIGAVLKSGFTQNELAAEFKVAPGTVSRWKDGLSCPASYVRGVIVDRLREMLGIAADNLAQVKSGPHLFPVK
jgi:hypothetical protein